MIPICIPTYKHPSYDFIDRVLKSKVYKNRKFKLPLYYFIYDIDWNSYNYDLYKDKFEELHFVKVPYEQYSKAMRMRVFIQNYMKDFDYFWMLDNDIFHEILCYNQKKNMTNWIPLDLGFIYIKSKLPKDFLICGLSNRWTSCKQAKDEYELSPVGQHPIQCIILNNKKLQELDIHYQGDINVCEDFEINLLCKLKGYDNRMLMAFAYRCESTMGGNSWYNANTTVLNTYEKYKDTGLVELKYNRKKDLYGLKLLKKKVLEREIDLWEII